MRLNSLHSEWVIIYIFIIYNLNLIDESLYSGLSPLCVFTLNCLIWHIAITTVVTISEILKNNGLATEKSKFKVPLS